MLQWMGGSRRKVTTLETLQSRKSTHKRQRQYFEQRRRQLQQTAGLESYADRHHSGNLQPENNRSLDVLSLLSLSTVAQTHGPRCLNDWDNSDNDNDFSFNYQKTHSTPVCQTNEHTPEDQFKHNEEGTSSFLTENEYSKRFPDCLPDHNENMDGHSKKLSCLNSFTTDQLSVIDLLGDGGADDNAKKCSLHAKEDHVAFSVEGLGKVKTETPVHSPEMPERSVLNGFNSPRKARRKPFSKYFDTGFDGLESQEDVMMQAIDPCDNFIEQSFCPSGLVNPLDNPDYEFFTSKKSSPFNTRNSNPEGAFDDDVPFFNIRDRGRNMWNGSSFFEDTDDLFCNNFEDLRDVSFDEFEDWNLQNKRSSRISTKRTKNHMPVRPTPYSKHLKPGNLPDFKPSDTSWYSTISIEDGVKDSANCFEDDSRESLSRLSEESCSSTAVRGDATRTSR